MCVCWQRRSQLPAPRKCKQILCSYRDQNEWYTILSGFSTTCCAFAASSATLGLPAVAGHSDVSLRCSPLLPPLSPCASPPIAKRATGRQINDGATLTPAEYRSIQPPALDYRAAHPSPRPPCRHRSLSCLACCKHQAKILKSPIQWLGIIKIMVY